jgi:hypothetical protein
LPQDGQIFFFAAIFFARCFINQYFMGLISFLPSIGAIPLNRNM